MVSIDSGLAYERPRLVGPGIVRCLSRLMSTPNGEQFDHPEIGRDAFVSPQ